MSHSLSSDPHAWLRTFFAVLKQQPGFGHLSPSHQFARLCVAIEPEHPRHAASLREWSPAAQDDLLKWLTDVTNEHPPVSEYEMWRVRKDGRELRCISVYTPIGIDVRVMEGADFRRTQVEKFAHEAEALAQAWRAKLLQVGWNA